MADYKEKIIKILTKTFIRIMIVVVFIIAIFYYNMYRYYHPKFIYVVRENLDKFNVAKDKVLNEGRFLTKDLKKLEISEFKIDGKIYTLVHNFPSEKFGGASDKIVTFEYFRGGNWESVTDSYGIVYAPDVITLKEGLKRTWWNLVDYQYIPISENWYFLRSSYTDLLQSRYGSLFQ